MKKRKINKHPDVKIDESLNKYKGVVLFPEKLAKANETLQRIGLPEALQKEQKRFITELYPQHFRELH